MFHRIQPSLRLPGISFSPSSCKNQTPPGPGKSNPQNPNHKIRTSATSCDAPHPHLPMKLTPQVLRDAPNVISPEGKLTVVLRNLDIPYIENLDLTNDSIQALDLTNNHIGEFGDVPARPDLQVVLLANNNISRVGTNGTLPLRSLLLANNNLGAFSAVAPLRQFHTLQTLLMVGNPIAREHHYRPFVIWLLPSLRVLDCAKVKAAERSAACDLFGPSFDQQTPAATALLHGRADGAGADGAETKDVRLMSTTVKSLGAEEKAELVAQLERAQTMEEMERIQLALKNGYVG